MKRIIFFLLIIISVKSFSQTNAKPCMAKEGSQFDFWVGDWNLTWNDTLHGTNHIEKMLSNCAVHENFSDPNAQFTGQSWSVYNAVSKQWQQTWIDNQGGYIVLTGSMENNQMVLKTPVKQTPNGKQQMRMVFYNIKPDSFDWSWEASTDGGLNWKPNWKIHYLRRL